MRRSTSQPNRGTPVRVYEDTQQRSWRPEQKATDSQMNVVFEILLERESAPQSEISDEVGVRLEVKIGTARAITSAALLYLREAGFVKAVDTSQRSTVWALDD